MFNENISTIFTNNSHRCNSKLVGSIYLSAIFNLKMRLTIFFLNIEITILRRNCRIKHVI